MNDETKGLFINCVIKIVGEKVASEYCELINRYPPSMRPIVIAQLETFTAATRATFSEQENQMADKIRDASRVVTILKKKETEEDKI